jgi:hypothetical protein
MVEAPGGDIDLTRTIAYLVSERSAADVAKGSYSTRLGSMSFWFPFFNFETRLRHRDPGYGLRTGGPPAICAVTIGLLHRLVCGPEAHLSAITSSSDLPAFHGTKIPKTQRFSKGPETAGAQGRLARSTCSGIFLSAELTKF